MIVETDIDGWESRQYPNFKPYAPPVKGYDWRDYHDWIIRDGVKVEMIRDSCHACDIRKFGCLDRSRARYFCKKGDRQSTLFEF